MDIQTQIIALLQGELSEGTKLRELLRKLADSPEDQSLLIDQIHMARRFAQVSTTIAPSAAADQRMWERIAQLPTSTLAPSPATASLLPSKRIYFAALIILLLVGTAAGYWFGVRNRVVVTEVVNLPRPDVQNRPESQQRQSLSQHQTEAMDHLPVSTQDSASAKAAPEISRKPTPHTTDLPTSVPYRNSVGGILQFDGQDDVITISDFESFASTGSMTIEAYIQPANTEKTSWLAAYTPPEEKGSILFGIDKGKLRLIAYDLYETANEVVSNVVLVPDRWYHIAGVQDGPSGTLTLYLNGLPVGEVPITPLRQNRGVGELLIGARDWFNTGRKTDFFYGRIRDVRIWETPLSQKEIFLRMTGNSNQTEGLLAYWPLDEGKGTMVKDQIRQDRTGELQGNPEWKKGL